MPQPNPQRPAAAQMVVSKRDRRRNVSGRKKATSKEAPFVVPTMNPNQRVVVSGQMAARLLQFASQRQRSRRPAGAAVSVNLGMEGLDGP